MSSSVEDFAIFMIPLSVKWLSIMQTAATCLQVPWCPLPAAHWQWVFKGSPFGHSDLVVVCNLLSISEGLSEIENKILKRNCLQVIFQLFLPTKIKSIYLLWSIFRCAKNALILSLLRIFKASYFLFHCSTNHSCRVTIILDRNGTCQQFVGVVHVLPLHQSFQITSTLSAI